MSLFQGNYCVIILDNSMTVENNGKIMCKTPWLPHQTIIASTVKPVLTATSEQRPPVNNGQTKSGQANFDTNFD
jgi:hypothetical protein